MSPRNLAAKYDCSIAESRIASTPLLVKRCRSIVATQEQRYGSKPDKNCQLMGNARVLDDRTPQATQAKRFEERALSVDGFLTIASLTFTSPSYLL